ncbi:efflux RND transporter periplasmic adaptor subunit [Wenzhouxiangella sp. EGI_FJ10305]|uniref:efflux RND transporter periplasmic adaptor subunit n=1 Tax=Wenzhouxiangella sp. EGI_FJ10305 TaxID=3243768 RepID=UPI0035DEE742
MIIVVVVILLTAVAFAMLERPPSVDSERLWYGEVERGELVREVSASGQLVAPNIRAVTNRNDGIVEAVHVLPGDRVTDADVLIAMSSPELEEDLTQARWDLAASEAEEAVEKVDAENRHLDIVAQLASAEAEYTGALLELQAQEELSEAQVYSSLELERQRLQVQQLKKRLEAEQARLDRSPEYRDAQERATEARLARKRDEVAHLESLVEQLEVRAGSEGVIQEVNVTEGERLTAGELIARIVDPSHLIARLKVPEREAADVLPGLPVTLELGRERIEGEVIRIDPTATDRTIAVDVELISEELPTLRPEQTISGRIELERIEETVHVPRPAGVREPNQTITVFVAEGDETARRRRVQIGRLSTSRAEVIKGLAPGERIVLADMSDHEDQETIRVR